MDTQEHYDKTLISIYQAFQGTVPFQDMLQNLATMVGGHQAAILCVDAEDGSAYSHFSYGYDDRVWELYNERFHQYDPRLEIAAKLNAGNTLLAQSVAENRDIQSSEYFNEISVPFDISDVLFGAFDRTPHLGQLGVSLSRSFSHDFFSEKEEALLQRLLPHLENAQTTAKSVSHALAAGQLSAATPDKLVLLVAPDMTFEPVGEDWLSVWASFGVLGQQNCRLYFRSSRSHAMIEKLVADAVHSGKGGKAMICGPGGVSHMVRCAPVPAASPALAAFHPKRCAVLELCHPGPSSSDGIEMFSQSVGLTAKEAEIVAAFERTFSLRETADSLEISYETARSHFKKVLHKSDSRNQAELIHKLSQFQ